MLPGEEGGEHVGLTLDEGPTVPFPAGQGRWLRFASGWRDSGVIGRPLAGRPFATPATETVLTSLRTGTRRIIRDTESRRLDQEVRSKSPIRSASRARRGLPEPGTDTGGASLSALPRSLATSP